MVADEPIPLMVLDDPGRLAEPGAGAAGLTVRELRPDEAEEHIAVAAPAFAAPPDLFRGLITPDVLDAPGLRAYLASVDGEPVATGLGVAVEDGVGVFNVATVPGHRRRGYGAAVTAAAIRGGVADGARWAWLQSTPVGYGVYERLGFRTVDRWPCWVSEGRDASGL
jgi:GNAT superfamily N-acetyltransferase